MSFSPHRWRSSGRRGRQASSGCGVDGYSHARHGRHRGDTKTARTSAAAACADTDVLESERDRGAGRRGRRRGFCLQTDAPEDIIRRITDVCDGLPQFNPSSQRQLINDLNMQQPQSRRDEARAMLDARLSGNARRWFSQPTGTPMPKSRNECSFRNVPSRRTSHPRETDYAWAGYRWRVC